MSSTSTETPREFVSDCGLPDVGFLTRPSWMQREEPTWSDTLDQLDHYLDWDAITRSIMEGGWAHREDGKTHVFIDN